MKLSNIYRAKIVECIGYDKNSIILKKYSNNKVYCRYGKKDRIIKYNAILLKKDDNCFYDLSNIVNIGDYANFCDEADDMNISKVFLVPEKNGDLYVDKASLKQYRYNEYENEYENSKKK